MDEPVTEVGGTPAAVWTCSWFAMCAEPATHYEPHPILGLVPACDRCPQIGRD